MIVESVQNKRVNLKGVFIKMKVAKRIIRENHSIELPKSFLRVYLIDRLFFYEKMMIDLSLGEEVEFLMYNVALEI